MLAQSFNVSGLVTAVERLSEGYNRVTIQSTECDYREVKFVYFGGIDRICDGRMVSYHETERAETLSQKIIGEGIDISVTVGKREVGQFRNRCEFIVRKEIEFAKSQNPSGFSFGFGTAGEIRK